jgi:hypothetical protein
VTKLPTLLILTLLAKFQELIHCTLQGSCEIQQTALENAVAFLKRQVLPMTACDMPYFTYYLTFSIKIPLPMT